MNIPDLIFEKFVSVFWVEKKLKFFDADLDSGSWSLSTLVPGSGLEKIVSGIRDKHPRSATLLRPLTVSNRTLSPTVY
jgi:hypothetical protein